MLTEFSEENAAAARRFVRHWQGMLNRPSAYHTKYTSEIIARAYRAAKLPPPRYVFFCESPLSMAWAQVIGRNVLSDQMGRCVRSDVVTLPQISAVRSVIGGMSKDAVRCLVSAVRKPIFAMTRPRLWAHEKDLRYYSDKSPLSTQDPDTIRPSVFASLIKGGIPEEWLPADAIGPFTIQDIQWGHISRYAPMLSFARRRLHLDAETKAAEPAIELLEEVCALMPYENACWSSARPSEVDTEIQHEFFSDNTSCLYESYEQWLRTRILMRSSIH